VLRGINYSRNDFRAINRRARAEKRLSANPGRYRERHVDSAEGARGITGGGREERTTTRQLTAQPDEQ